MVIFKSSISTTQSIVTNFTQSFVFRKLKYKSFFFLEGFLNTAWIEI